MESFATRLLNWGQQHGRTTLPWQMTEAGTAFPEPYRVWVAEIMLQQTQVKIVIPYYQKFMHSFPDLPALAAASLDAVLAHWSGLGYYARARNLHKTACLRAQISPHFPVDPADLEALPGIGLSTANAIVSQATDQVLPILDGNARRVLARHAGIIGWPGQATVLKKLWQVATDYLPPAQGAAYTQAIMDLGAGICSRTKPDCGQCPLQNDCFARIENRIDEFPGRKARRKNPQQYKQYVLFRDAKNRIYLHKRPPSGIWGGLWCLPEREDSEVIKGATELPSLVHDFSHYRLHIRPVLMSANDLNQHHINDANGKWFSTEKWQYLGLPAPIRQILEQSVKIELSTV